jgi:hypothetical protein
MAQQDIVGGLFGVTPEMYQQQRMAQQINEAAAVGAMSPEQFIKFSGYRAGQAAGNVLGGLLGVEDPQLAMVRDVQQMRTQFDVSTPAGLRQFAQALGQKGYTDLALQATARAADIDKNIATAEKARTEKLPNIANLQLYRERLVQGGADPRLIAEVDAEIKGLAEKGTKIVLPSEQQDKALREARVKKLIDYEDRASSASSTLQLVQDFNSVLDKAFTGTAAGAKLTAGQVANALGVTVTGTTESEQLDQLFAALTVGQAKNLKGALSDKDVKFLKEAVGSRGLTKDTLVAVINRIAREAEVDRNVYNKASSFQGDLAKFDFAKAQEESRKEVNEKFAKQQRLNELRRKQGQSNQ